LHTEGLDFAPCGVAVVKALVLTKFMLLCNAMKIGSRNTTVPLIWPTLHKAFAFLVLLIIMTIIEEAVVGLFHHQSIAASLGELIGPRPEETIAGFLIMLPVLIPFGAFRVLGEGRLEEGISWLLPLRRAQLRPWSATAGSSCPTKTGASHDQAAVQICRNPDPLCALRGRCFGP
jgi:hypothetical protein